ncbi:MAG: BON domain-containing protein [Planctomycetia bacterium]|nr:BON domain-containing protein [Planctomycetia bacterium]
MRLSRIAVALVALAVSLPGVAVAGDREMAQQIANELRDSGALVDYNIGVKYQDGAAWLSGRVRSDEQLTAAIEIVERIEGIEHVINDVEVVAAETPAPTKKTASRKAKSSIARQTSAEEDMPLPLERKTSAKKPRVGRTTSYHADDAPVAAAPGSFQPADAREVPDAYYGGGSTGAPMPASMPGPAGGVAPVNYDQPNLPNYAWPSYAAHPNYAAVTYPKQYSASAWPYIGPFYPYPQVPLGWRKVTLEWDDGWWFLDFDDVNQQHARRW